MNKKTFNLITAIVGGLSTIGIGIVTYTGPEYATAINSVIGIAATTIIECCSKFLKTEEK